ncbi:MAG: FkbM family methyltransferase [Paracoccaceae bacterium]|nr:FkbM family methyltransferase [Paracoccaceae bacterium]
MIVTVGEQKIWVRPGTPDLRVAFQSLRSELDILSNLLPRNFDGLIVDAGGYIGTAALKLAKMYPQSTVVTIEASSENFKVLQKNVEGSDRIVPVKAALHAEPGLSLDLVDRGTGAWGFSIATQDAGQGGTEAVTTVTLSEILDRFPGKPLGIVKMDIEGGEYVLFDQNDPTLEAAEAVFIELHDRIVPGCTELFRAFSRDRWLMNAGGEKFLSLRRTSANSGDCVVVPDLAEV